MGSRTHSEMHSDINDAVEALEAKVGINSSATTTSHDYKLSEVTSTDKAVGKTATQTLTNKTLTSPVIATISNTGTLTLPTSTDTLVGRATTDTLTNKTLTTPTIASFTNATHTHQDAAGGGQLNATSVFSAGTVPTARLGSGSANSSTYLRGDQTWDTPTFTGKFGGTGADGALSATSGNTNIDLGGARVVVKNYSSISITGTGSITFTNPHANGTFLFIKCSGAATLTSSAAPMLSVAGCGAAGGATNNASGSGVSLSGNAGTAGVLTINYLNVKAGAQGTNSAVGQGGAVSTFTYDPTVHNVFYQYSYRFPSMFVGGGGGSGGGSTSGVGSITCAAAGNGGGALAMEVAGAWNFTTSGGISVAGQNGGNGTVNSGNAAVGGSGGGAGGSFVAIVGSITANTGTVTVAGGTGGNSDRVSAQTAYGGGGGASIDTAGSNGTSTTSDDTKTGGDGAAGKDYGVNLNTEMI